MRALIVLCLTLLTGLPARATEDMLRMGFILEGYEREFQLYKPQSLPTFDGPRPLILVLHGVLSTDEGVFGKTLDRFNLLAERHGFLVAYPKAMLRAWDLGDGLASPLLPVRRDDIAYLERVIELIDDINPVDFTRIFATGFSMGGQMSFALACKRPGLIRAVMTVSMPLPDFLVDDCAFGPPLGALLIHGTDDFWVPFEGGTFPVGPKLRDRFLSHEHSLQILRRRNRCSDEITTARLIDNLTDATAVTRREWRDCEGAPVISFAIRGGGHAWPREEQSVERAVVGRATQEIDASEEAWAFFRGF